jgi:hypothetical protein
MPFLLGKRIGEPNSMLMIAKWGKMSIRLGLVGQVSCPETLKIRFQ